MLCCPAIAAEATPGDPIRSASAPLLVVAVGPAGRDGRRRLLTMQFRTFRHAFIDVSCQIVMGARGVRWRIQA